MKSLLDRSGVRAAIRYIDRRAGEALALFADHADRDSTPNVLALFEAGLLRSVAPASVGLPDRGNDIEPGAQ